MPVKKVKPYYIAGPMTGIPKFNFPAFKAAAKALRKRGLSIVSPAELDGPKITKIAMKSKSGKLDAKGKIAGQTWGDLLSRDVKLIADGTQGIIFLPGWGRSRGARLEAFVGLLCQHKFYEYVGRGRILEMSPNKVMLIIRVETNIYYGEWECK